MISCKKDPEYVIEDIRITSEVVVGTHSAVISGAYSYPGEIKGIKACITKGESAVGEYAVELNGKEFTVEITGLQPSTTYQYYFKVDHGVSEPYVVESELKEFTTLSVTIMDDMPTVRIMDLQPIDSAACRVRCEVLGDGGSPVVERGICWNTHGEPSMSDAVVQCDSAGLGMYTVYMEQLSMGRQYYVRAYARNATGIIGQSNVMDFEMSALPGMSVDVHVGCEPEEGGTATGGGSYEVGTQCTVTATPNPGYTFVNWTENGSQVSSELSYSFTVTVERNLVANFSAEEYIISVEIDPEEGGTATGAGGYAYGDTCRLVAAPRTGYDFVSWTSDGSIVSHEAECSFIVMESATYTAHFQVKSYTVTLTANPAEGGSVSGGGTYEYGTTCTVHAVPAEGYAFENWTDEGDIVSDNHDYTFMVTSSRTLKANFRELPPDEYTVTVSANPEGGGTVTGGGTYEQGQQCTVNAVAAEGYTFANWTEGGEEVSANANWTFIVNGDRTLVANFTRKSYTITATANPSNGGTTTGGGIYEHGQSCTVIATAANGYEFSNWTENGEEVSTNANYRFTVTQARTLVANFTVQAPNTYTINASSNPSNGGSVSGGGTYEQGQTCTVSAMANTGYTFNRWTENGDQVSNNASYSFTVNANRILVAQFQVNSYTISASANPTTAGSVSGGGSYNHGQNCTLTAMANTGYAFDHWTRNGTNISGGATLTFTVTSNATYVAHFTLLSYTISASANPTTAGSVNGGGSYNHGQSCTLTATANTGYTFNHWTRNGTNISGGATLTFTVTSNATYVAHFTTQSYTISASANPVSAGNVSGGGNYIHGQSCTLTATANTGYVFDHWTQNNTSFPGGSSITFTVTESAVFVAHFISIPGDTFTESWDDGLNGWTNIDADGDGYVWDYSTESPSHSGMGHIESFSYINNVGTVHPNNYIVSPQMYTIGNGSVLSFWACGKDASYPNEHFGIAISTTGNANASDFTTISEWTMWGKADGNQPAASGRDEQTRAGNWHNFTIDLSAYAGQQVWIAIRHFNCSDYYAIIVDDMELSNR